MSAAPDCQSPSPEQAVDVPLIPVRILNEFVYCPRLAFLEWVAGEWRDSADTLEGRFKHRRVDRPGGELPTAPDENQPIHARSVTLGSEALGIIGKLDLVEGEGHRVSPVDYKRGKRPHVAGGAWQPERVQLEPWIRSASAGRLLHIPEQQRSCLNDYPDFRLMPRQSARSIVSALLFART
ncbi:MAG: Dna2/Cas4 domain-containing protein [Betaproteobacteria bacterium]|nr:Dna2/Cas4 domain-containing protein [Betaproteobacteria bacterium]